MRRRLNPGGESGERRRAVRQPWQDSAAAFGTLAEQLRGWLLRRLQRDEQTAAVARNPDDAHDIVQETFLKAWAKRDSFDPVRGSAATWFWAIARNTALDLLRKRHRKPVINLEAFGANGPPELASGGPEPAGAVVAAELRHVFDQTIGAIPHPVARRAVELRFLEGERHEQIARELGVPVGTVGTWVHRFRLGLRAALRRAA
jgi:RNA polymerase sigma-70 factor, ECF subfamily